MPRNAPLFHSPVDLAHHHWRSLVEPGGIIIDATCGNGHDTLFLAKLTLTPSSGALYALDLQATAIAATRARLLSQLPEPLYRRVHFLEGCHANLPGTLLPGSVKLIVYNLGYLPGGDKNLITKPGTTLESLHRARALIEIGGAISIACYTGHPGGAEEERAVVEYASSLDSEEWNCCHHRWLNRKLGPSLLFLERRLPRQLQHGTVTVN